LVYGLRGEILVPGGMTAPFTIRVLSSGVPSFGSAAGLSQSKALNSASTTMMQIAGIKI